MPQVTYIALYLRPLPPVPYEMLNPNQVLTELNGKFPGEENDEMFFTIWYGVYDQISRELTYASGGHPPAVLFGSPNGLSNTPLKLRTPNLVVGGREDIDYRQSKHSLAKSSELYVFSDGVYKFNHQDGRIWRYGDFVNILKELHQWTVSDVTRYSNAPNQVKLYPLPV